MSTFLCWNDVGADGSFKIQFQGKSRQIAM